MQSLEHAVVIVGGGPTGLMLAGELALAGVDVAIAERRLDQTLAGSRAGGLHARSIEILDQRGIAERFLAAGQTAQVAGFAGTILDLAGVPTRHPYGLALRQKEIERLLAEWVESLPVRFYRSREVVRIRATDNEVLIDLSSGETLMAQYLVGCDGGRSLVRREARIGFPGSAATVSHLIAEAAMRETPAFGVHRNAHGIHSFGRAEYEIRNGQIHYAETGPVGVMVTEPELCLDPDPTLEDLSAALIAACGTDYGVHDPIWISRFTDAARQAERYRQRRILLAGDAAHIHPPEADRG